MQEKLNNVTTTEAALEIAKEAGFSITAEDLKSHMKQAMSDAQTARYNKCVKVTYMKPNCSDDKALFCSKFKTETHKITDKLEIEIGGHPAIIEPCI